MSRTDQTNGQLVNNQLAPGWMLPDGTSGTAIDHFGGVPRMYSSSRKKLYSHVT